MDKFKLAFGLHNHQPVGNFQAVFKDAHQKAYLPFLELLREYDNISISLHQSGILWRWQEKGDPAFFELVGSMVDKGQVELMTGGFYEPILTSVPERDIKGQIARLNKYIKDHFEVEPEGLWLTERIWEPHLPKVLAQSGVKYLPVDDTHFVYAGLSYTQLTGPFVTEHENHKVTLLPISKRLRYLIPFGTVDELIDELKAQAERSPSGMAIYADDGEKFGVWPKTHKHCYEDGWLRRFFDAVQQNSEWLEIVPLREAAGTVPHGRVYLPSASYAEMLHWSLPADAFLEYESFERFLKEHQAEKYSRFVRGGHWRGFLTKYEEANLMHKKMLAVSGKLAEFERDYPDKAPLAEAARDRLYAGQCNCSYWHGVFGGLYLPHIRQAVYSNLVEADHRLNQLMGRHGGHSEAVDYDADGQEDIVHSGDEFTAVFKPARGGMMVELSLNKHSFSVTDTMTRRREGYHLRLDRAVSPTDGSRTASIHDIVISKETGLKDLLVDDWYLRRCFIDHFFTPDVEFDKFRSGRFGEEGDFVLEPYKYRIDKRTARIDLFRDGHLWRAYGPIPIRVVKQFLIDHESATIDVVYEISTSHETPVEVDFAIENNFNFQAGHAEDRYILIDGRRSENSYLDSVGQHDQAGSYAMVDDYRDLAVALSAENRSELWHMPIFTVSLSEGGFEKVYQGTSFINRYHFTLTDSPVRMRFTLIAGAVRKVTESVRSLSTVRL